MLSQRPPLPPSPSSAQWRYRAATQKPLLFCSAHRTASVVQKVSHDPDVLSGIDDNASATDIYASKFEDSHGYELSDYDHPANNGSVEVHVQLHEDDSSLILHQQDFLGQCYSSATVSAMARLMGHHDDQAQLLAAGQTSVVVLPRAQLVNVLKAGSGTPLDEASAALALLCEAGQYDAVLQFGNPLLKAASAALPFSPLGVGKQPVPHLEHLASDLALSIALAHISLAGGAGSSSSGGAASGSGGSHLAATSGGGSGPTGELESLEEVHGHLESALQVLERHAVAAPLQQEVAYCMQGVAAAFAEEVLRSTPPVAPPPAPTSGAGSGPSSQHASGASGGTAVPASGLAVSTTGTAGLGGVSGGPGPSAAAVAARRAKAIAMLRGALWRGSHHVHQQPPDTAAAAALPAPTDTEAGGMPSGAWVPELTPDERTELMTPLRGLLAASEHIALYGPVASGQKPYGAVQLSDQELYDLAIAHLAQGVSTGWPQHVLQALSYFERVAHQQQQQQGAAASRGSAGASAAAADVSFERSVCEALLGRRTTAAGPAAEPSSAAPSAVPPVAAASSPSTHPSAPSLPSGAGASTGSAASAASVSSSSLPSSLSGDEWDEGEEVALLRRLEAQLLMAATAAGADPGGPAALPAVPDAALSFSVNERGDGPGSEFEDDAAAPSAAKLTAGPGAAASEVPANMLPSSPGAPGSATAVTHAADGGSAGAAQPPHQQLGGKPKSKSDRDADVARKYGWAESWLELSVMPCFPETAVAGPVSLARWFADPRVILFNKLLAVRSGEVQVTAALGSAVAHVSDASRQRLWQLWQAAAHAVSSARGHNHQQSQQQQQAAGAGAHVSLKAAPAAASPDGEAVAAGGLLGVAAKGGAVAPLASGLLAQSRAALQDMAPRAAAAASSAVAAAAAAVSSAAASSPRAVAAAAGWMVPFGLSRWAAPGPSAGALAGSTAGAGSPVTAPALPPPPRDTSATTEPAGVTSSTDSDVAPHPSAAGSRQRHLRHASDGGIRGEEVGRGPVNPGRVQSGAATSSSHPGTNNVVPFPGSAGGSGSGSGASASLPAGAPAAPPAPTPAKPAVPVTAPPAPPLAGGLVDVALASPPAGVAADVDAAVAAAVGADAAAGGALWVPDAEGHLRPRPRMVTRVVRRAKAAAASLKDRMGAIPVSPRDWAAAVVDPALADEAMSREAVRRVAAVAAQAVCLGALAAYVGNRIVASGALQAAAASGYATAAAAAAAAPTMDASTAQVAAAARAVARWLGGAGVGAAAQEALGQWSAPRGGGGGGVRPAEALPDVASAEAVGRLVDVYGKHAQLDEAAAAALLRGWAAARAAAPALSDPRDRSELLSGLLGGRALKVARAEADRNARMGRRVQLQRIDVEVEQMRCRPAAAGPSSATATATAVTPREEAAGAGALAEVAVTAVVVTAGTEISRAAPLPLSYCSRERLSLTFRRALPEGQQQQQHTDAGAQGPVWRLVDIRDAPPPMY